MATYATTFEEYVDTIATESPHAAMMDWFRRLELTLHDYFKNASRRGGGQVLYLTSERENLEEQTGRESLL